MTKQELATRLKSACARVLVAEQELTEIDSKFGDADHGLTMAKIARAIADAVDQAEGGIQSMLANHMGMICDGAKTTCALKIATGIQSAVLCATLAMQDISPTEKEGIVCKDVEETIRGVGLLSNEGVPQLDPTILQVMLNK